MERIVAHELTLVTDRKKGLNLSFKSNLFDSLVCVK